MSMLKKLTRVRLSEIKESGWELELSSQSEPELAEFFKSLTGGLPLAAKIQIVPMGNTYQLSGHLKTALDLPCSRCAEDLVVPVDLKLQEVLIIERTRPQGMKTKSKLAVVPQESDVQCIFLNSDEFNLMEYLHEAIALAEPVRPLGSPSCEVSCPRLDQALADNPQLARALNPAPTEPAATFSAFSVLSNIKLTSS